jgi:protein Mpv17
VLADQAVFTPINLTLFLSTMSFLEAFPASNPNAAEARTKTAETRVKERLDSTFMEALTKNLMIWPWVQLANFSVVPLHHRVLVVNVVALGWNCYLSYLNSKGSDKGDAGESEGDEKGEQKVE